MKRAFEDNHRDIIVETDNHEAFLVLKNFLFDVPQEVASTAKQIMTRLHDPRWACSIVYVYAERNMLATYLARLGGERCSHLYTFSRPIGCVEELLSLDLGFGPTAPQYQDIEIYEDEPDPVNFGSANVDLVMNWGYTYQEDFFAVDNGGTPEIVDIHNFMDKDFMFGNGYAEGFVEDHPINVTLWSSIISLILISDLKSLSRSSIHL